MKSVILILALTLVWNVNATCQEEKMASSKELQKWIKKDKESTRAKTGDNILVVIVKVKDESKQEFELWIKDVLYSALNKSKSEMKKAQLKATRWLEPVRQNEDSTWTYSWIMDPLIPNTNYDIPRFLDLEYGEELGKKHWEKYMTFMAELPQTMVLKQTDF
jgi:hypothetical protein